MNRELKRLLMVCKTTRFERYEYQGLIMNPYVQEFYMKQLKDAHDKHNEICKQFKQEAERQGKHVTMIKEH